jgi:Fe-S cluster biogenesis protein NfuA/nitrite reductase/ring-hydroxylating ferredoxin subunit
MNVHDMASTMRTDLAGFLGDIERLETIFAAWDENQQAAVGAYKLAVEELSGEALRRLIRALKTDPAALAAMKNAIADEVVYAVLRRHDIVKASLNERVEAALEGVRPMLASHGGDVELVKVKPPSVEVRFIGACDGCPASALTFHAGVKKAVQDACPEITDITQVKGLGGSEESGVRFVSPFALGDKGNWVAAGLLSDIPEGSVRSTIIGGEKVLLSRNGATVTCFQNACAHLGFPIHDGEIENGIITCPHHGFQYDLSSGECLTAPEVQLQSHAVRVIGPRVEVRISK